MTGRGKMWQFFAGVVFGLGSLGFGYPMTYGLAALQVWKRFVFVVPAAIIGLTIAVTSFWVTDWLAPWMFLFRIVLIASLIRYVKWNRGFISGLTLVMVINLGFVIWHYFDGVGRPHGLVSNASGLGMAGAGLFGTGIVGAITLGLSQSRTYMLVAVILGFMGKSVRLAIVAGIVMLVVTAVFNPHRLTLGQQVADAELRVDHLSPATAPVHGEGEPVGLRWFGTGYRDYNHETGRANPHTIPVLMAYELGVLALIVLGAVTWLVWQHRTWWVLALVPALLLTDEYYARPEGLFGLVLISLYMGRKRV